MKFGENLYNLRKAAKMSQEKLAEKIGVTRQSVSKWENGESYPEMDNIMKLCDIFHCTINELVHENMVDIDSLDENVKMSVVKFKEEKQKKIRGISKAIYVIARIGKIITTIAIPIILLLLVITPIVVRNVEFNDNTIVFNGTRIDDKITITEEKVEDSITLKLKVNNVLFADESDQEAIFQIKEVMKNNSKLKIITFLEIGFICLIAFLILYRMILSRLEKLFINISQGDTPFTLENVKYIKQMAKIMILALILPNAGGVIFEKILNTNLGIGFELIDIIQILFLFGIAYIFEYGHEIQLDSSGKMYGGENE